MFTFSIQLEGRYTHADLDQLYPNYTAGTEVKIVNGIPANNTGIASHQLDSSLPLTNIISNIENGLHPTNGLNGKRELLPSPQLPQSPQKKPRLVPEQPNVIFIERLKIFVKRRLVKRTKKCYIAEVLKKYKSIAANRKLPTIAEPDFKEEMEFLIKKG